MVMCANPEFLANTAGSARGPRVACDQGNRKTVDSGANLPQVKIDNVHAG